MKNDATKLQLYGQLRGDVPRGRAVSRREHAGKIGAAVRLSYPSSIIEADHGALKQVIRPTRGFQTMKTAFATIKGFEIMGMIRRGHCLLRNSGVAGEVQFVNKLFGLPA